MYEMYLDEIDDFLDNGPVYFSWVVDECGETLYKVCDYSEEFIDNLLVEHPEWRIETRPAYM